MFGLIFLLLLLFLLYQENVKTKHPQLQLEYEIYVSLQNSRSRNFAKVYALLTHCRTHTVMVCTLYVLYVLYIKAQNRKQNK